MGTPRNQHGGQQVAHAPKSVEHVIVRRGVIRTGVCEKQILGRITHIETSARWTFEQRTARAGAPCARFDACELRLPSGLPVGRRASRSPAKVSLDQG